MFLRFLKKTLLFLFCLGLLTAAAGGAGLYWLVAINPGPEIELANIERILGRESPVYYRDGVEKIGVLFQDAHRQYLPYHRIPKDFINAIVAAEDDQFFSHHGIDLAGIARAIVANVKAGRIVQGGSTITQQTAKNLFKRQSRTIQAKLKELLHALQLEYHYPKEKILEFYINQFFVSGNGHGLGVAARYYFDKEVEQLTLLEHAFIAGSVKRPNYYNPFTKSTEEGAERARQRADERAAYVLRNMHKLGYISPGEYRTARSSDIVFSRGRMSFSLNTVMDLVQDGLAAPEIVEALEENGISNVTTSGIKVYTTVDRELQDSALTALRKELSRLDVRLRGYARDEVQREYTRKEYPGDLLLQEGAFLFGTVQQIETDDGNRTRITVRLDAVRSEGVIDQEGLQGILTAFARYRKQRWSEADSADRKALLAELAEGDRVYVSVREIDLQGKATLDLERFPLVQGAALVMQQGAIRAMAGGAENRYFNRAVDARRSMGSVFKPFLFAAALQLGWSSTDLLANSRDVFVYQDIPYFPRPDHISPHEYVSMSWAGVDSENLAAIWLLYHLTDHLTPPRLREVAAYLDLAPRTGDNPETSEHFKRRIRDRHGITVDRETLLQAAYDLAVQNLEADFLFEGLGNEYAKLKKLPYGLHYDRFAVEMTLLPEEVEELSLRERKEYELRLAILGRSFLALQECYEALQQYRLLLAMENRPFVELDPLAVLDSESGNLAPSGGFWENRMGELIFSVKEPMEGWREVTDDAVRERLSDLDPEGLSFFWDSVLLEDHLTVVIFNQVREQMEKESRALFTGDPYSMEILSGVHDYRVLIGLAYLIEMARESGVRTELEPVLSLPLGSNVVSLLDGVRMYETLVTGKSFAIPLSTSYDDEEFSSEGMALIDRIESVDGEVVYERSSTERTPLDPLTATTVANILQNTVRHGTGRYARDNVRLRSQQPDRAKVLARLDQPLQLLGKTGTANDFRNAAFFGYVPAIDPASTMMELRNGHTVGVYVGFDDNRPMEKGTTHVTGAVGALPTWSMVAESIVNLDDAADRVDLADLSFNGLPLRYRDIGQLFVLVNPEAGGRVIPGRGGLRTNISPPSPSVLTYGRVSATGSFEPERVFRPFWMNLH